MSGHLNLYEPYERKEAHHEDATGARALKLELPWAVATAATELQRSTLSSHTLPTRGAEPTLAGMEIQEGAHCGANSRRRAPKHILLALLTVSACAVKPDPPPDPPPVLVDEHALPSQPDTAPRLAELSPLYIYAEQAYIHRPGLPDCCSDDEPRSREGVLVRSGKGVPVLKVGDRLAVVRIGMDPTVVVVTDQPCPPGADDCLDCGTSWATRVEGPELGTDEALTIIGPLAEDPLDIATPSDPDDYYDNGLAITKDGVRLRQRATCTHEVLLAPKCVVTIELVLGDVTRELSRWSSTPREGPQMFVVRAWPGRAILTGEGQVGGPGLVVMSEWHPVPEVPVKDATYWIVDSGGVVGSVRFDSPYTGGWCTFMANPCWAMTAIQLPDPGAAVDFVIGPVPEPAPPSMAVKITREGDEHLTVVLGPHESPWATVESRSFECRTQGLWNNGGICFETIAETDGRTRRTVSYFPYNVHHARSLPVCDETR